MLYDSQNSGTTSHQLPVNEFAKGTNEWKITIAKQNPQNCTLAITLARNPLIGFPSTTISI